MRAIAVFAVLIAVIASVGVLTAVPQEHSRIAFHSNRDGNWEIYVMNADGSGQTRLTDNLAGDGGPS